MIDWEGEWRAGQRQRPPSGSEGWSARARAFAGQAADSGYAELVLRLLAPEPEWTALDVGCGAGTLAIPLARRTASVTAVDFSPEMLDLVRARCAKEGVQNVAAVLGSWEDDWDRLGIGAHDLVVASRSLIVEDLGAALAKLDRAARRRACVVAPVGDGPSDRQIFQAAGRPFARRADYVVVVGLLHEMGIHADVALIGKEQWSQYPSHGEALRTLGAMLSGATPEELERLREYLGQSLVAHDGGWRLPAPRSVRWAVISWANGTPAPPNAWRRLHGRQ